MSYNTKLALFNYHYRLRHFKKKVLTEDVLTHSYDMQISDLLVESDLKIETDVQFTNLPGRNPSNWPNKIDEYIEGISTVP
jgi:hypothetical protein